CARETPYSNYAYFDYW
nr:immunoglobulin heavy chain junction region [Macaca mulatta]MOV38651.1 immunoglobulin heavy chain junction region [Macaca mulatta]MOV38867.1 immunoglobulin heavy chain junction region [Macaca mulatta]MOV39299.1 immunoglobulin heavy chain junction region [Macaca mulatta]MOV39465.1 immunoglobulin heavy chain junction region [Macaca mulatta]